MEASKLISASAVGLRAGLLPRMRRGRRFDIDQWRGVLRTGSGGGMVRGMQSRREEFEEVFSRARGPGGQHVNKVSTAVTLRHVPSGMRVTVSGSRSQAANRSEARKRLDKKLAESKRAMTQAGLAEAARERRRKARRSRATKAKMVEAKRRRAETKKGRRAVDR